MRTSCSETEIKHVSLAPKFTHCRHVIKELVYAFSCVYIELWMHLGSLESTQEARVALGLASSNSYASFVLSKPITRYTHAKHEPILKKKTQEMTFFVYCYICIMLYSDNLF